MPKKTSIPRVWKFTTADIARAAGLSSRQVRRRLKDPYDPLNPADLLALCEFILSQSGKGGGRCCVRAVCETGGDMTKLAAMLKVSRATLYRRAKELKES